MNIAKYILIIVADVSYVVLYVVLSRQIYQKSIETISRPLYFLHPFWDAFRISKIDNEELKEHYLKRRRMVHSALWASIAFVFLLGVF